MKIRLSGTAGECAAAIEVLRLVDGIEVLDVSGGYANRGDSQIQRVYVEARVNASKEEQR